MQGKGEKVICDGIQLISLQEEHCTLLQYTNTKNEAVGMISAMNTELCAPGLFIEAMETLYDQRHLSIPCVNSHSTLGSVR